MHNCVAIQDDEWKYKLGTETAYGQIQVHRVLDDDLGEEHLCASQGTMYMW